MRPIALCLVCVLVACSDNNTTTDSGTPTDGGGDAGVDAGTDAGTDAGVDAGVDAGIVNASISISNNVFSPLHVTVSPGGSITVHNLDAVQHTVTSQSALDQFTPGPVNGILFDTGNIAGGMTATINIPSNATIGTIIPFYCAIHTTQEGSGTVTVQ